MGHRVAAHSDYDWCLGCERRQAVEQRLWIGCDWNLKKLLGGFKISCW